jgi:hypothetical protein
MKNIMTAGNNGNIYQPVIDWAYTISVKFKEPDNSITGNMTKPIETS